MKPPKRERRQRVIGGIGQSHVTCGERWTLMEKQQLLDGLKSLGPLKLESIQKEFLPQRQMVDIKNFIKNLKLRLRSSMRHKYSEVIAPKAPIETWLTEAEGLTHQVHDYSFSLAEVFSVFGNLEPHDMLPHGHAPNWSEVYLYLAALLRGTQPEDPSPSNAMILLDLIDSLADELRSRDVDSQRELMKLKANLLQQVTDSQDKTEAYAKIQADLEEDPLEKVQQASSSNSQIPSTSGAPSTFTSPSVIPQHTTVSSVVTTIRSANQSQEADKSASSRQNQRNPRIQARLKRSPLYTLNPFCIPVKYLKLSEKTT